MTTSYETITHLVGGCPSADVIRVERDNRVEMHEAVTDRDDVNCPHCLATPPAYTVSLVTSDYRGDHAADVQVAIDVRPGETVAALVARALANAHPREDHLALRLVQVVDPPKPDRWTPPAEGQPF